MSTWKQEAAATVYLLLGIIYSSARVKEPITCPTSLSVIMQKLEKKELGFSDKIKVVVRF